MIQWRDKAADPPGDARSDLWFVYHLGKCLKELYAESKEERDRGLQALLWDYEEEEPDPGSRIHDEPDVRLVLKEINGYYVHPLDGSADGQRVYTLHDAPHVANFPALKSDGSTACGSWIYSGVYPAPDKNLAASRITGEYPYLQWGFAWPANRRILYTPRGEIDARAMVTRRMRPLRINGNVVHQIGLPFHWGFQGKSTGSITNDLAHMVLEPNVSIEEAKAFLCNVRPGRLS